MPSLKQALTGTRASGGVLQSLVLALGIYATGCECSWDNAPDRVVFTGAPTPPLSEEVVTVSRKYCHRRLVGYVDFVYGPSCQGYYENDKSVVGCTDVGLCHLQSQVSEVGSAEDATHTALAHEIGHYCWDTRDEDEADRFAGIVNKEVLNANQ